MNGRRLFRNYAKLKGKEAKEFVKIEDEWYNNDVLTTKDNEGRLEETRVDYKEMIHLIIKGKLNQ